MCNDFRPYTPLRHLARKMTIIYDHHLKPHSLTIGQYSLICKIASLGSIANIELAMQMGMERSTLSRALKPLFAGGLIEAIKLPDVAYLDKRSFVLQLTEPGLDKLREAQPNWNVAHEEIKKALGHKLSAELSDIIGNAYSKLQHV